MKQKFLRIVSKVSMFLTASTLVFSAIAPMAANAIATEFSSIKDVVTRSKQGIASNHVFTIALSSSATFDYGEEIWIDFSSPSTAFTTNATTSWDTTASDANADFDVTYDSTDMPIQSVNFVSAATPATSDIAYGTCTTAGQIAVSMVTTTTPSKPIFGFKRCGASGAGTASSIQITIFGESASGQLLNPATATSNKVTASHRSGGATVQESQIAIATVAEDQVAATAIVDPSLTFDIDIGTSNAASNDPTTATNPPATGTTIILGALNTSAAKISDDSTINGIWVDLDTNADDGAIVQIRSATANGLVSALVSGDTVNPAASGGTVLTAGTNEAYGVCVASAGNGTPTQTSLEGTFVASGNFGTTCSTTASASSVVGLNTTLTTILTSNGWIQAGKAQIRVGASVTSVTPAHADYSDTITLTAYGTF